MTYMIAFALCLLTVPAIALNSPLSSSALLRREADADTVKCSPGSVWVDHCNRCRCIRGQSACTKRGCIPGEPPLPGPACEDGSRWLQDDCNWCECHAQTPVCTRRTCNPARIPVAQALGRSRFPGRPSRPGPTRHECTPNSHWRDDCNYCFCTANGMAACTLMACVSMYNSRLGKSVVSAGSECEGGSSWLKDQCNWCHCTDGRAVCTDDQCSEESIERTRAQAVAATAAATDAADEDVTCRETSQGGMWKHGCNWCRCVHGGRACTRRGCPPGSEAPANQQVCRGDAEWKNDCNWCYCRNETAYCTKMACPTHLEEPVPTHSRSYTNKAVGAATPEQECTPGSYWRDQCNFCFCHAHLSLCTRMACPPGETYENTCTEGSRWKQDCNWCHCFEGHASCTEMGCLSPNAIPHGVERSHRPGSGGLRPVNARCTPDSRWRDDCNWCGCRDGHGVCTRRTCTPGSINPDEPECRENSSWTRDCNDCHCTRERKAVCTRKLCPPTAETQPATDSVQAVTLPAPLPAPPTSAPISNLPHDSRMCTPGSRYKQDCNWCTCGDNGIAACTIMACLPEHFQVQTENEVECEDGAEWSRDCNRCTCNNGRAVCTALDCNPASPEEAQCEEGSRWREMCNWCTCRNGAASCTRQICYDVASEEQPECEDGAHWKRDCNWCSCRNGMALCTKRACPPEHPEGGAEVTPAGGETAHTDNTPECTDGSQWKMDCNWCSCMNGVGICTLMGCPPGHDGSGPQCTEGSRWRRDCNWCHCQDGHGVCTLKACITGFVRPQLSLGSAGTGDVGTAEECTEGSSWQRDCNWCNCVNGRGVCTRRACVPGREIPGPHCTEGSRWKDDCNWCQCFDGHASCTQMGCLPPVIHTEVPSAPEHRDEECTEGSSWREDCNWCHCNEGRGVCSRMACPPGVQRNDTECTDGSSWKKDCNWCSCSNGRAFCTLKGCITDVLPRVSMGPEPRHRPPAEAECTEGSRWRQNGCDTCTCNNGVAVCSHDVHCPDGGSDDSGPQCTEGSRWRRDCNWCHCRDGHGVCTLKACIPSNFRPALGAPGPARTPADREADCTDGSQWKMDECNWCSCMNGVSACNRMLCVPGGSDDSGPQCTEGSRWRRDCNWCHCRDGHGVCTLKACIPSNFRPALGAPTPAPIPADREADCTDGSRWRIDECNWCSCMNGVSACTLMSCVPGHHQDSGPECTDGSRWREDCNWCDCRNGVGTCTRMACEPGSATPGVMMHLAEPLTAEQQRAEEHGHTCTEGSHWKAECNSCTCRNGHGTCTRRGCLPGMDYSQDVQCQPNSSWKEDCNWCRCTDGRKVCTRKSCAPGSARVAVAPFRVAAAAVSDHAASAAHSECTDGTSWVDDCNICHCYRGFAACTLKACLPERRQEVSADRCRQPIVSGNCFASIRMFGFNTDTHQCESFLYGGCQGNDNRFSSLVECRQICG